MRAYLDARFEARRAAIEMSRPRTRARHIRWRRQLHRRRHTDREADDHIFGVGLVNDWSARDIQAREYQPPGLSFQRTSQRRSRRGSCQRPIFPSRRGAHSAGIQLRIPRHEFLDATRSRSPQSICRRASMVPSLRPFIPNERAAFAASGPKAWVNGRPLPNLLRTSAPSCPRAVKRRRSDPKESRSANAAAWADAV